MIRLREQFVENPNLMFDETDLPYTWTTVQNVSAVIALVIKYPRLIFVKGVIHRLRGKTKRFESYVMQDTDAKRFWCAYKFGENFEPISIYGPKVVAITMDDADGSINNIVAEAEAEADKPKDDAGEGDEGDEAGEGDEGEGMEEDDAEATC